MSYATRFTVADRNNNNNNNILGMYVKKLCPDDATSENKLRRRYPVGTCLSDRASSVTLCIPRIDASQTISTERVRRSAVGTCLYNIVINRNTNNYKYAYHTSNDGTPCDVSNR